MKDLLAIGVLRQGLESVLRHSIREASALRPSQRFFWPQHADGKTRDEE